MIQSSGPNHKARQVILSTEVAFEYPQRDIGVAQTPIANASWVNTSEGTVVIDTLLNPLVAAQLRNKIRASNHEVKYVIYTHGHRDHVGGSSVFKADNPAFISQRFLVERLEKYRILKAHTARINSIQFNIPFSPDRELPPVVEPTQTFNARMTFKLGDKTFDLYHARAETDDAAWVFVPEVRAVFVGDLIIWGFPNIGNPFKPTRFALSWARALEDVRAKEAELLIAHGGRAVYKGGEIKELLDVTIEGIYSIHDQVVDCLNEGMPLDEMIHTVKLPDHLKDHPALQFVYSRPEFAVYNIYRWYHGYFDLNPANLIPRPDREVNAEIFNLIASSEEIVKRAQILLEDGQAQLALQVLDVLLKQEPDHIEARKLHLKILETLCEDDDCLMSRNTWVYFMDKDRELLLAAGANT